MNKTEEEIFNCIKKNSWIGSNAEFWVNMPVYWGTQACAFHILLKNHPNTISLFQHLHLLFSLYSNIVTDGSFPFICFLCYPPYLPLILLFHMLYVNKSLLYNRQQTTRYKPKSCPYRQLHSDSVLKYPILTWSSE